MAAGEKLGKMRNVVAYFRVLSLHLTREKRLNNSILQSVSVCGSNPGTLDTEAEALTNKQSWLCRRHRGIWKSGGKTPLILSLGTRSR
jgi:hypothetical protein